MTPQNGQLRVLASISTILKWGFNAFSSSAAKCSRAFLSSRAACRRCSFSESFDSHTPSSRSPGSGRLGNFRWSYSGSARPLIASRRDSYSLAFSTLKGRGHHGGSSVTPGTQHLGYSVLGSHHRGFSVAYRRRIANTRVATSVTSISSKHLTTHSSLFRSHARTWLGHGTGLGPPLLRTWRLFRGFHAYIHSHDSGRRHRVYSTSRFPTKTC